MCDADLTNPASAAESLGGSHAFSAAALTKINELAMAHLFPEGQPGTSAAVTTAVLDELARTIDKALAARARGGLLRHYEPQAARASRYSAGCVAPRYARLMAVSDVTQMLNAAAQGDRHAAGHLLPLVYAELRKLAAQRMAGESPGHTEVLGAADTGAAVDLLR